MFLVYLIEPAYITLLFTTSRSGTSSWCFSGLDVDRLAGHAQHDQLRSIGPGHDQLDRAPPLTDPGFLIAILVAVAVFRHGAYAVMPALGGDPLKARMQAIAIERDELRAKQRARLAEEADRRRGGLGRRPIRRHAKDRRPASSAQRVRPTRTRTTSCTMAGFRGQNPLTHFLFLRLVLPFVSSRLRSPSSSVMGRCPTSRF